MNNNIKIFKLTTNESIIGELITTTNFEHVIKYPFTIKKVQEDDKFIYIFDDFIPLIYDLEKINIDVSFVLTFAQPSNNIINRYLKTRNTYKELMENIYDTLEEEKQEPLIDKRKLN